MRPFWHPISALLLVDPPIFAHPRVLRMMLDASGAAEVVYAGDRMAPAVPHGTRVGLVPLSGPPQRGEVVAVAQEAVVDLLRVDRVEGDVVVLVGDSDADLVVRAPRSALVASTGLRRVLRSRGSRRRARWLADLAEGWNHGPAAQPDPATTVRKKYDAQAAHYAAVEGAEIEARLIDRIRAEVPPGGRIVVAGSGTGRECFGLARSGFRVRGVDFAPEMVGAARARAASGGLAVEFVAGDLRSHDEPPSTVDAVLFTYDVYSFLPDRSGRIAVLTRMRRWLTDRGVIFLSARRVESAWQRFILTLQRLRAPGSSWGNTHTRWIAEDGTLHRSFVRMFSRRAIRRELAAAELRGQEWEGGHLLVRPERVS